MKQSISERIEAAFASIDGIQSATPKPFLLTRLNSAMATAGGAANMWYRISAFIRKPVVSAFSVALLISLNIAVFTVRHKTMPAQAAAGIAAAGSDFSVRAAPIYNIENPGQ